MGAAGTNELCLDCLCVAYRIGLKTVHLRMFMTQNTRVYLLTAQLPRRPALAGITHRNTCCEWYGFGDLSKVTYPGASMRCKIKAEGGTQHFAYSRLQ